MSRQVSESSARRLVVLPFALSLAAAVVLTLAGCATPGEATSRSKPLDAASLQLDPAATTAPAADWWKAWRDPQLDALVERALADSPSLRLAQSRLARAAASREGVDAQGAPQVGLELDATRQRYTENGLIPPPLAGATETSATLQASARWEIDFFGRHRAALDAALGSERAAAADAQAARVLLATNVVRGYVQLARLVEQREIAQRTLAQREETLQLVAARVSSGLDTNVELRQSEGSVPDARQQIAALDEQIALARHALATLTAQRPDALDALAPRLGALPPLAALPSRLPADLLGRRADIEAARQRVQASRSGVAEARAAFYPNVDLVAFAGFSSLGLNQLLDAGSRQLGIGPAITLPIFDGGALRANYRGRNAELDSAIESYNQALLGALREVADQVASTRSIAQQQSEQAAAQAAAESAYALALQRYRAGLGTYLTVLSAETTVLQQRRLGADLRARALDTQALLAQALGGGYDAEAAPRLAAAH
ncbi:efflux transporter outer membrane subunit [Caldimonas sp. KR1-144]|uniref:efflux transporter outer membrane subunit n=1 Tax=Caldimonas sp. KR1-144 TaxID=3400911 RepID=UPI003C0D16AE